MIPFSFTVFVSWNAEAVGRIQNWISINTFARDSAELLYSAREHRDAAVAAADNDEHAAASVLMDRSLELYDRAHQGGAWAAAFERAVIHVHFGEHNLLEPSVLDCRIWIRKSRKYLFAPAFQYFCQIV